MPVFEYLSRLDAPADAVFDWHARPGALERLLPPWQRVRLVETAGGIADGGRLVLELQLGPVRRRWVARHRGHEAGRQFQIEQVSGPFAAWLHTHRFVPDGPDRSLLEDHIEYHLPLGPLGALVGERHVERTLARICRYRHEQVRHDLARHQAFAAHGALRVAITGASGLVGSSLAAFLTTGGHRVDRIVRSAPRAGTTDVHWNPEADAIDAAALEGVDAVVHLAGESIAAGAWTDARKARILESRTRSTALLARTLARLTRRPQVLVSASAVGFYGSRGDAPLGEDDLAGTGFLADVCRLWEAATEPAVEAGIRVVTPRIGMVLSARGGALGRMLTPFRLGLGSQLGTGRQYVSWIGLDDLIGIIHFLLFTPLVGAINAVAPHPVTNAEFTRTLARVLRRPALLPMPAPVVRLAFGEMGQALLLDGARVLPVRLVRAGVPFRHPELEGALRSELGR